MEVRERSMGSVINPPSSYLFRQITTQLNTSREGYAQVKVSHRQTASPHPSRGPVATKQHEQTSAVAEEEEGRSFNAPFQPLKTSDASSHESFNFTAACVVTLVP